MKEKGNEATERSGRRDVWHEFTAMRAPTRRFAAPMQDCRRCNAITGHGRQGGDDNVLVLSLTGGHAVLRGLCLDWVDRTNPCVAPDGKLIWRVQVGGIFCAGATKRRLGALGGRVEMLLGRVVMSKGSAASLGIGRQMQYGP
jgi:hypothetical protein